MPPSDLLPLARSSTVYIQRAPPKTCFLQPFRPVMALVFHARNGSLHNTAPGTASLLGGGRSPSLPAILSARTRPLAGRDGQRHIVLLEVQHSPHLAADEPVVHPRVRRPSEALRLPCLAAHRPCPPAASARHKDAITIHQHRGDARLILPAFTFLFLSACVSAGLGPVPRARPHAIARL